MNYLKGMRCYLCGAISFLEGEDWRDAMEEWLRDKGVVVLNPLKKRLLGFDEGLECRERRNRLKKEGAWEVVCKEMRRIRCVDLRMIDISDFIIVNVDNDVYTIGTWEEVSLANREKKPILLRVEQGKENCGDWVFGMFDTIFSEWEEIKGYLEEVNRVGNDNGRWYFFNF